MIETHFVITTYSKSQLAEKYHVSMSTLKAWILKAHVMTNEEYGNYNLFTPAQVKAIVDKLGEP